MALEFDKDIDQVIDNTIKEIKERVYFDELFIPAMSRRGKIILGKYLLNIKVLNEAIQKQIKDYVMDSSISEEDNINNIHASSRVMVIKKNEYYTKKDIENIENAWYGICVKLLQQGCMLSDCYPLSVHFDHTKMEFNLYFDYYSGNMESSFLAYESDLGETYLQYDNRELPW